MTLKTVMEALNNQETPSTYSELPNLFDSVRNILFPNFPIYDESHRETLQNLIMGRFLMREICETPYAKWQWMFNQKLMEIMPYYNKLYASLDANGINVFDNTNYTRTIGTEGTVTMKKGTIDTSTSSGTSEQDGTYNPGTTRVDTTINTPQSEIESFLDDQYLSGADKSVMSGEDVSHSVSENSLSGSITRSGEDTDIETRDVTETVSGKMGGKTYGEILGEIKDKLFNVDNLILDELEELFFMVY